MGHKNRNRGKESNDDRLFDTQYQLKLKEALIDYSHLLTRGYGQKSSLQLVGNRYRLNARQQQALMNMGASDEQVKVRNSNSLSSADLKNQKLSVDGFNLLITMESFLSNAYVFKGRDGFFRDISSVHGSYKRVSQSENAVIMIGNYLMRKEVVGVIWLLDAPVSNSGRLKAFINDIAKRNSWNWETILDNNPDKLLAETDEIVVTSDAWVLDRAKRNFNLVEKLIADLNTVNNNIVDLSQL